MNLNDLCNVLVRVFLVSSFLVLAAAVVKMTAFRFGYMVYGIPMRSETLAEYGAVGLLCTVTLLLRQVREGLKKESS